MHPLSLTVEESTVSEEPLHGRRRIVHDLPQLYSHPSGQSLISTLRSLALSPPDFSKNSVKPLNVSSNGLASYLTCVISSPLSWLEVDVREEIWNLASTRLAERSGRSATPAITRNFWINETVGITLHEPSLTGDLLGLKTWSSSLILARMLRLFKHLLPETKPGAELRVLELGSGTGLVGLAAACTWSCETRTVHVTLTDLPEIIPNLKQNVELNQDDVDTCHGKTTVCALDWADEAEIATGEDTRFPVIIAADPLYSPEHPKLLVDTIGRRFTKMGSGFFLVAVPLRDGYESERQEMIERLQKLGLKLLDGGEEHGYDDWENPNGEKLEIIYAWSIWTRSGARSDPRLPNQSEGIEISMN